MRTTWISYECCAVVMYTLIHIHVCVCSKFIMHTCVNTLYCFFQLGPNVSVGKNAVIGAGVRIRESIILGNTTIQEHSCVLYTYVVVCFSFVVIILRALILLFYVSLLP